MNIGCIVVFFFFFQAEDGIRDYKVTGVQTCALPIFLALSFLELIFCEESTIGIASAAVFELENAVDSRLGGFADFVDRKSTRLNSSHLVISYAVFCLKKKTQTIQYSLCLDCGAITCS